jgi:hypothetical protein
MIFAILSLGGSSYNTRWITVTRLSPRPGISKIVKLPKDPRAVPKDTLAAAIVVEQLAQLLLKPNLEFLRPEVVGDLEPMINGLLGHLVVLRGEDGQPDQPVLLDGCFNYPKQYATNSEFGELHICYLLSTT